MYEQVMNNFEGPKFMDRAINSISFEFTDRISKEYALFTAIKTPPPVLPILSLRTIEYLLHRISVLRVLGLSQVSENTIISLSKPKLSTKSAESLVFKPRTF